MNTSVFGGTNGTDSRSTVTATVGYTCIALSAWSISMINAGWFSAMPSRGFTLLLPLAIIIGIMGILAYLNERVLDAVIFFVSAAFLWSVHDDLLASIGGAAQLPRYAGWSDILWAVVFCYVWLGSFKSDSARMLFLLVGWLTFLAVALADWAGVHVLMVIGGYLGLILAIVAGWVAASAVIGGGAEAGVLRSAPVPR